MTDPLPWTVGLWLLAALLLIGCAMKPAPAPGPTTGSPEAEALSLLCERAVFATATQRCLECPACREDFQSTLDILDVMLDERMVLEDLVNALSWMKVDKLSGPDGVLILTADTVLIAPNATILSGTGIRPIQPEEVETVAMAVWVGLNKWKGLGGASSASP